MPFIVGPDQDKALVGEYTNGCMRRHGLDGTALTEHFDALQMGAPVVSRSGMIVLGLKASVAAIDRLNAVKDLAVQCRAKELEVFGMGPDEGAGCLLYTSRCV